MSELQKEESAIGLRAGIIQKISECFSRLPNQFCASELYRESGIVAKGPQRRMLVASVLRNHFRCENVTGVWRKQ